MRTRSLQRGKKSSSNRLSCLRRAVIEPLETRRLLTVVFNLQFGAESLQSSDTSKMIQTPPVFHVVLWGTHWGTGFGQFNPSTPENIAKAILNSTYLSGLTEYGISSANLVPASIDFYVDSASDPPSNFNPGNLGDGHSQGQAQTELTSLVSAGHIAGPGSPSDVEHAPVYAIIEDPTDSPTNGGYNTSGSVSGKNVNIFSVGTDSNFNNYPDTFSHETAERLSDIEGGGAELDLPNVPLPTAIGTPKQLVQVGDGEAEPGGQPHETYRIGGPTSLAMVQPFYSNSFTGYIAPDGNSERFDLAPIWNIDTTNVNNDKFTDTYNLTVNGDQLASKADNFVISRDSAGGTEISLNGQNAWFDPATAGFQGTQLKSITLNGLTGNDTFTVDYSNGDPIPTGGMTVNGGTGTNTLTVTGNPNTWKVTGANAGSVNGEINFSNVQNLTGGNVSDIFEFFAAGSISGNVTGGAGIPETLDYSALVGPITVNLQNGTAPGIGGSFSNITSIVGSAGSDTLVGSNAGGIWDISGPNAGFVDGLSFSSFENLTGGTGADTFTFESAGSVSGNIDGGAGFNALDYAPSLGPVTVNLATSTASGIGGTFSNITDFAGSSSGADLLIGPAGPQTYALTALNAGTVGSSIFSSFENLTGTGNGNVFAFQGGGVSGNIDGGGIGNTLDYSATAGPVSVSLLTDTASDIGGTFSDVTNFVGSASLADTIGGSAASNTWFLTGANTGFVGVDTFSSFEDLLGGPNNDTFVFLPGGSVSGNIDGSGGVNTLDYSALLGPVTVNLGNDTATDIGGTFANIENFIGSASPNDTLIGPNVATLWSVTGTDTGSVGADTFSRFENLTGGTANDTFAFQPGGSISGNIDGGGGTNTLDYSALAGPVTVNLQTNTASNIGGTFANIENFVGSAGSDTLIGPNVTTQWNITGPNSGTVNADTFSSFENLIGGSANDTFSLYDGGSLSGKIDGGAGSNILDYSHYSGSVIVNLALNTATGIGGGIFNINGIIGGLGNDMFIGNGANNFFKGGSGRNILIGGGGADTLIGGAGDNILIGDSTIYDLNMAALNAIFAEWTRTDLSFEQRIADLISPGNQSRSLNGIYTLNKASIIPDNAPDTLVGGTGLTWAFVDKGLDSFSSKSPQDHVTQL